MESLLISVLGACAAVVFLAYVLAKAANIRSWFKIAEKGDEQVFDLFGLVHFKLTKGPKDPVEPVKTVATENPKA